MEQWANILKNIPNNEKDVKTAIVSANNYYSSFGPMSAKLSAEMMKLKNKSFEQIDQRATEHAGTNITCTSIIPNKKYQSLISKYIDPKLFSQVLFSKG